MSYFFNIDFGFCYLALCGMHLCVKTAIACDRKILDYSDCGQFLNKVAKSS